MADWADYHIPRLLAGETISFTVRGHSMKGRVKDGSEVTCSPVNRPVREDDIVLCKVKGRQYLHLVKAVKGAGPEMRYLIGNNLGHDNGWISGGMIFGIMIGGGR
jgi:hypothetical protein